MENNNTETPSADTPEENLQAQPAAQAFVGKHVLQPVHSDIAPATTMSTDDSVQNSGVENSQSSSQQVNIQSAYPEYRGSSIPKYQRPSVEAKHNPVYGVYVIGFLTILGNFLEIVFPQHQKNVSAGLIRIASIVGILLGVGILLKMNVARLITIVLMAISALGNLLSLNIVFLIFNIVILGYLFMPHVSNEFN